MGKLTRSDWVYDPHLSAEYTSRIYDTGSQSNRFVDLSWSAQVPPGSSVAVSLRSGRTESELLSRSWSGPEGMGDAFTRAEGEAVHPLHHGDRCVQYRVDMRSADPLVTPEVESVSLRYQTGVIPPIVTLFPNYPNPLGSSTTFHFGMPKPGRVRLTLHDVLGRHVATIIDRDLYADDHRIQWQPGGLAAGVYYYTLETPFGSQSRRLIIR